MVRGAIVNVPEAGTRLGLFFTWDVSLAIWQEKGLLQREVRFYEELADKGVNVTFYTWGGDADDDIAQTIPSIHVVPLHKDCKRPASKLSRALISPLAVWKVRDDLKLMDILKANQMWGGWAPVLAKWISGKPLIVRNGFELYQFTIMQRHSALRRAFIYALSWMTYKSADLICVATEEDRQFVIKTFAVAPEMISLRPNWIDTDRFSPQAVTVKDNRILFVGRLTEQKNLKELISAVAGTTWSLDIAGDGELKDELQAYARETGAQVTFLGSLPNDQLPALYCSYPVFVLPSHYEGNPKTLLEAMSCGCACVGTDVPGIRNLITDRKTGVLSAPVATGLKEAITTLMNDAGLRRSVGQAARKQIIETQTLDSLVARELASYTTLMSLRDQT